MNLENRTYQFRLTRSELLELCMKLAGNSLTQSRLTRMFIYFMGGMALLSVLFSILRSFLLPGMHSSGGTYVTAIVSLIFLLFLVQFLYYLRICRRNGFTEERRYCLSQGYLLDVTTSTRYHGSSFSTITETPRLLLLRQKLSDISSLYVALPKRVFSSHEELLAFQEYLKCATPVEASMAMDMDANVNRQGQAAPQFQAPPQACNPSSAHFSVSFQLSREDFAHLFTELMRICRNQKPLIKNGSILARTLLFFLLPSAYGLNMILRGQAAQGCILFGLGGALAAFCLASTSEISKESILRQMKTGRFPLNETGFWSITAGPDGLSATHGQNSFSRPWDTYTHCFETVDTLFLIRFERGNLKQYLFIPKWALSGPEEHAALNDICRAHGKIFQPVEIPEIEDPARTEKRAKWRIRLIAALFVVLLFLLIIVSFLSAL